MGLNQREAVRASVLVQGLETNQDSEERRTITSFTYPSYPLVRGHLQRLHHHLHPDDSGSPKKRRFLTWSDKI